jgi:hypothetical protein
MSHSESDSQSERLHLKRMVRLHSEVEAVYTTPITPLLLVGGQQSLVLVRIQALQWNVNIGCNKQEVKTLKHLPLWRWSHLCGERVLRGQSTGINSSPLKPRTWSWMTLSWPPDISPILHLSYGFMTYYDFADKNVPGLGIAHEVKEH